MLVHGGMAQNVGPILEMVTEKYLLRSEAEWQGAPASARHARRNSRRARTRRRPRASARRRRATFTARSRRSSRGPALTTPRRSSSGRAREFGDDFWGFWMLGGMSGGGMGFIFAPERKAEAQQRLQEIMSATKRELQHALPFAMEPVVYDFAINEHGTFADWLAATTRLMPRATTRSLCRDCCARNRARSRRCAAPSWTNSRAACRTKPELRGMVQTLFDRLLPRGKAESRQRPNARRALLDERLRPRAARADPRRSSRHGRIGLAQNRLPPSAVIEDVRADDVIDTTGATSNAAKRRGLGEKALRNGEVAVVTLAAGAGSRWTQGAGVVKALHPFCKLGGRHRTFIETHLAKSRRVEPRLGRAVAARLHHELSHAPADRRNFCAARTTTATKARCCSRPASRSACAWCRWCATCASPGKKCRSRCSTSSSRKCARACAPR